MAAEDVARSDAAFLRAVAEFTPSARTVRVAQEEGFDLEQLRAAAPMTFAAMNAAPLLRTQASLSGAVHHLLAAGAPAAQLFSVPVQHGQCDSELRIFPPLGPEKLAAFETLLAQYTAQQCLKGQWLFFRVVEDKAGVRREFAQALRPAAYREGAALVGPFADEADALRWSQKIDPRLGLVADTLAYAGQWFCDVFSGE